MAAAMELDKSELVPTGLNSDPAFKLAGHDVASGKDGIPSYSSSSISSSGDATSNIKGEADGISSIKGEADKESVGVQNIYNPPTSNYNYYYPGYNGPFPQLDDHGYFQADGSHVGMQSDNGSVVYYLPGYNPYASGALIGVEGQSIGQQPYFSSSGYLQHPVSYGSAAVPCYSWDSTYAGDVSNGSAAFGNGKYGSAKSNGLNSMKSNGNIGGKSSKSNYMQPNRPLNKVSPLGSDFSAGLMKGYHHVGNFSSFSAHKQGPLSHNGTMNYRQNGRMWNGNDRNRPRDKFYKTNDFEASSELTCGPRASNKISPLDSSAKEDLAFTVCRDQYNQADFKTEYKNAKFYVIKSYNEDDIHKSIKYAVWASTPNGNKKLDAAFCEAEQRSSETGTKCPIFLFFSVNGSGQFVGLAEMVGQVDFEKDMDFWQLDKWSGFFPVKWHVIKDIPNNQLRHIILENNDKRPVTFSRDTQEIGFEQGLEMLNIFKGYSSKASLLDDFNFYENRETSVVRKSNKLATLRMEINNNGDFPKHPKSGERKHEEESWTKKTSNPSSLINLTKNLSLNGYSQKSNSIKKPIENSIPAAASP
ncbi:YTH domain-containing protein ECT1 [Ricinus communis]|uniref:YTH domain-containing protein ECT1 n=1 Tax=Ricinus communis TaxID=3988 RepID=UPI00201AA79A|nr:YTH domain-containing protein ECT1 [Ricinus communis]